MADIDYAALFAATPSPYLVLDPDLVIVEANQAYLDATARTRQDLIGQHLFEALPVNPADPESSRVRTTLNASLHRVLASRQPETTAVLKYDLPLGNPPGAFGERWWSVINTPVLGPDGQVMWVIHRVEDVTEYVQTHATGDQPRSRRLTEREAMEAELFGRARMLQELNEELRQAHTREREVAVALQQAMLSVPDMDQHPHIAVRYLPATRSLNVCGDWYDVVDLADGRFSVAVGDVVGHGLQAAAVMGMLRSALSAAIRALERPAQALEVLGLYARSVEGALNTTAFKVMVDQRSHLLIYSNAGHPPPVLVHPDGSCELLDQALDPPLGARPEHVPRPQAGQEYDPGDTLVLYTDGLIERRDEDIDASLAHLTNALGRTSNLSPERMADALLAQLGVATGTRDDIVLVIIRL
ncbi:PP2C family protein-serine/threonine phosphatase [Spirillospora sp. CA-128828]|uniref:PP2C family protein-serine/threonine phosphatase n=1 Tax=Spirillospora sp. CA-128828 TaxID=3240033 RepID=UPI003D9025C4